MKLKKTFKPKIRPFKGSTIVNCDLDNRDLLEFVSGMGYLIYEDPTGSRCVIISDKVLTYGDLERNPEKYNITKRELNLCLGPETILTDELDEACI